MLHKSIVLIIAFVLLIGLASAESGLIDTGDTLTADLDNGAYIFVPGYFDFTNLSITTGQLQFWLNDSQIQWRTNTNKTLTNITFNTATDNLSFNANGTDGYLNFSGVMNNGSYNYSFYLDDVFQSYVNSSSDKITTVNYTGAWDNQLFLITPTLPHPPITNVYNFTFLNEAITPSVVRQNSPFTISVDINDSDGTISTAIVKISGTNYTMTNIGGDTWSYTFTATSLPTDYYVTNFYAQDNGSAWNSTTSTMSISVLSSAGSGSGGGITLPTATATPTATSTPETPIEPDKIYNISIDTFTIVSDDSINIYKLINWFGKTEIISTVERPGITSCVSNDTDIALSCYVVDDVVITTLYPDIDKIYYMDSGSITLIDAGGNQHITDVNIYTLLWWPFLIVGVLFIYIMKRFNAMDKILSRMGKNS